MSITNEDFMAVLFLVCSFIGVLNLLGNAFNWWGNYLLSDDYVMNFISGFIATLGALVFIIGPIAYLVVRFV